MPPKKKRQVKKIQKNEFVFLKKEPNDKEYKDFKPIAKIGKKIGSAHEFKNESNYKCIGYLCLARKKNNKKVSVNDLSDELAKIGINDKQKEKLQKLLSKQNIKNNASGNVLPFPIDFEVSSSDGSGSIDSIELPNNYCFMPLKRTYPGSKRESIYITGKSNAGKSKWISDYLGDFKEKNPDSDIALFSNVAVDEQLDKHKPLRIDKYSLIENPITDLDELKNTCCVFDDTNSIPEKKVALAIRALRDSILETGRHHDITCVCTSHLAMNRNETIYPIRESYTIVIFPRGNEYETEKILTTYCGMSANDDLLNKVLNITSRWISVHKNYPSYVIHKRGAYL